MKTRLFLRLGAVGGWLVAGCLGFAQALAAAPPCTAKAAQAAAPPGMNIGAIDDLNPELPRVPTGALLVPAAAGAPAHCLVTGSVVTNHATGKTANFGLALPLAWNNKFIFSGCSGYCGVVFQTLPHDARGGGYPANALAKGYAIVATDNGHASNPAGTVFDASWALASPGVANEDALIDFFHRAVHSVAVASRHFLGEWYSGKVARAYFIGCSDGGREAMVEATRYPDDFDGYIAGNPFFDVPGQILAGRAARALLDAPDSYIPPELLTRVDDAVYESCDAADGVTDRLIQNPGKCSFDPRSLLCRPGQRSGCLSRNQAGTLTAWFSAAKDSQGRVASFGYSMSDLYNGGLPGANLFAWTESAGPPRDLRSANPWGSEVAGQPPGWVFYDQSLKFLVERNANFDSNRNSPVDRRGVIDEAALARLEARTQAGSGDDPKRLGPFLASNRKLILYHGYSDGFINPFRTIRFYEDWAKLPGGYDTLKKNARLFMVPGMYHCNKGPGPNFFDALGALERWVEHGRAPEAIPATKYANDDRTLPAQRTMPLCAFPTQARYSGKGNVNDAANWSCTANQDLLQVGPAGEQAGLRGRLRR